jgi:RecA-family ATPase
MSADPAQFTLPFSHYARLGYLPVPLHGKVPYQPGWQSKRYEQAELDALDGEPSFNVGLLCENIVGLDIDLVDAKHAKKIEALIRRTLKLPKNTPRRVGNAPKCLLIMRVERPLPGFDLRHARKTVLFQLLGAGKQFVVSGIHPDTQRPYTLNRPLPKVERLPLLDAPGLVALREALMKGLAELGYDVGTTGTSVARKGNGWSGPPWTDTGLAQAGEALQALDPDMCRADWINVGMALADGTHGGGEGFDLWDSWSNQSAKYRPREMMKQWKSFKPGGITRASLFKNQWLKRTEPHRVEAGPNKEEKEPGRRRLSDLEQMDPGGVPWLVSDLLTHGAHLLVGRPKGGKSWTTMDLAYAVANGGEFVGKKARRGRVLWFASEDDADNLARRTKVRGEASGDNVEVLVDEDLHAEALLEMWKDLTFWEMLDARLTHDHFDLVIVDTQKTCEAVWDGEQLDGQRNVSVTDAAYRSTRLYEKIARRHKTCIVLVHHTGKQKNNKGNDYHERINMPASVVAGVTGSMVLADLPDKDLHEKDDFQRVLAVRGRHMAQGDEQLMVEIKMGRVMLLGKYIEVVQSRAQAEVLTAIEALLRDRESTTIGEVAEAMNKHRNTVQGALARAARLPGGLMWKGRRLDVRSKTGIRWAS